MRPFASRIPTSTTAAAALLLSSSSYNTSYAAFSPSLLSPCNSRVSNQVFYKTSSSYKSYCYPGKEIKSSKLFSVSAYSGIPSDGKDGIEKLKLPVRTRLPLRSSSNDVASSNSYRLVEVGTFDTEEEIEAGRILMNDVIIEGKAWPFEPTFETEESFRGYFLSHAAFLVRDITSKDNSNNKEGEDNDNNNNLMGCFYIKPNFPGRCNHICNGGFIVQPNLRGKYRIGTLMGSVFLKFAKELGYKSAYFNLVFQSNDVSVKLWERLGFIRVATIPNAARLEGMPIDEKTGEAKLDTAYGYYYDLTKLPIDYDPLKEMGFYSNLN